MRKHALKGLFKRKSVSHLALRATLRATRILGSSLVRGVKSIFSSQARKHADAPHDKSCFLEVLEISFILLFTFLFCRYHDTYIRVDICMSLRSCHSLFCPLALSDLPCPLSCVFSQLLA